MKMKSLAAVAAVALGAMALNSCETATGTGALVGAGTGALIAGGHHGHRSDRIAGAAIGAGVGALIGAAIDAENATAYGPPRSDYPYGRRVGRGLVESPYPPHQVYDLRGVPRGALVDDRVGRGYFRKP
jgi:predicted small secreted protein